MDLLSLGHCQPPGVFTKHYEECGSLGSFTTPKPLSSNISLLFAIPKYTARTPRIGYSKETPTTERAAVTGIYIPIFLLMLSSDSVVTRNR